MEFLHVQSADSFIHTILVSYVLLSACVPRDQTLEDICEEFQDLSDIQELNAPSSFYSSQEGCPIPALLPAAAPAVVYNWPAGNPLYGMV